MCIYIYMLFTTPRRLVVGPGGSCCPGPCGAAARDQAAGAVDDDGWDDRAAARQRPHVLRPRLHWRPRRRQLVLRRVHPGAARVQCERGDCGVQVCPQEDEEVGEHLLCDAAGERVSV